MKSSPNLPSGRILRVFYGAFTLVEILVSLAVLAILLLISAEVIGTVQTTWTATNARVNQFREARTAFDIITRNISQATLNTYVDYDTNYLNSADPVAATTQAPTRYQRKTELRFVCGPASTLIPTGGASVLPGSAVFFQAPLGVTHDPQFAGLDRLLCGRGYYVQYSSDEFFRPGFITSSTLKYRYRLMEFSPPSERSIIYANQRNAWMQDAGRSLTDSAGRSGGGGNETSINRGMNRPVADNIVALVISPMLDPGSAGGGASSTVIAENFAYDSDEVRLANSAGMGQQGTQYLLPPLVRVVLVAIDERSAERLVQTNGGGDGQSPPFGTQIHDIINGSPASQLNQSLEEVARVLREEFRVNYRIFSTTVALRGAKWST